MKLDVATLAAIIIGVLLTGTLACTQPVPSPAPTPTPQPVEELYQFLENEKASNPTRLEKRVEDNELFGFTGAITNIEDDKIQFHIDIHLTAKDEYVECKFDNKASVLSLDAGRRVTVYGNLYEAFPTGLRSAVGLKNDLAVKFKSCRPPDGVSR